MTPTSDGEASRPPPDTTPGPSGDEPNPNDQPEYADIPSDADEETRLKFLTVGQRDQDDLERDIGRQADQLLTEQADERDKKRMAKADAEIKRCEVALSKLRARLAMPAVESRKLKLRAEIAEYQKKIEELEKDMDAIQTRINDRHKVPGGEEEEAASGGNKPLPNESRRDFLIRTGKITPFSKIAQTHTGQSTLGEVMLDAEVEDMVEEASKGPMSHQNLMKPGFQDVYSDSGVESPRPAKRRRPREDESAPVSSAAETPVSAERPAKRRRPSPRSEESARESSAPETPESGDEYVPDLDDRQLAALGESEDISAVEEDEEEYSDRKRKATKKKAPRTRAAEPVQQKEDFAGVDDGNEKLYKRRLQAWVRSRAEARKRAQEKQGGDVEAADEDEDECYLPHPTQPDAVLGDGFRIPGDIYPALFDYQKTGVQWLHELYTQNVGGIVGDEMGLGKTIQAIAFIAGLHYSKKLTKPVIVVCPATVMKQWVNEFHRWWPPLRVSILHTSGSGMLDTGREERMEREMEMTGFGEYDKTLTAAGKAAKKIVDRVERDGHVLVTTYSGLQTYAEFLIPMDWETAILDEGHKIRNPNASITIRCKELRTPNRIILSGTPMQNNLTELWSLFDFVFPMRLGTLVNFRNQFEFPIKRGGYANASNLEFETAMQCAETLKDAISPYLLQRFKVDVAADLPAKKEQVLFCKLTRQQREAYQAFLNSDEMRSIAQGKRQMLFGIDYLRKVCNHPDLVEHKTKSKTPGYGAANKSGKMQVVKELLSLWTKGGHKTLLFAQHRIMLDILEKFIRSLPGINYRRMDGDTPIKSRQDMVDEFNNSPDLHVFLLTTKVGGLGVNLTGADRVIIYDPDWNPSTDIQARERSWRLGQKREVEIYRLMSAGTIEEKIYHRQIFKQFLTNKVLKDPKQRQTFQMSDLHDLFTLGTESADGETETGNLFRGSEVKFQEKQDKGKTAPEPGEGATAPEDLAALSGIHHTEQFRTSASDGKDDSSVPNRDGEAPAAEKEKPSDSRLLSTIFAKSGVHSVLEHDAIVNSTATGRKRKVQADPAFIQREAKRAAAAAAEQLKRAEAEARSMPAGVPTWTGMYGEGGRPEESRLPPPRGLGSSRGGRAGPSSSSILSNLAARQGRPDPHAHAQSGTPTSSRSLSRSGTSTPTPSASAPGTGGIRGRQMLEKLRDFMITHGGTVPTQMLVDHFDRYCRAVPGRSEEFKEMLRLIARLERGSAGRGRWVLKEEWRRRG